MQVTIYISRDVRAVELENPDNPGIGGSETAVVEVCRRLRLAATTWWSTADP